MKMPFGRYEGLELDELPADYLAWLRSRDNMREREWRARQEVDAGSRAVVLSAEVAAVAEALVSAGYRSLAHQHHPDHGGDGEAMALVNAAVAALRQWLKDHAVEPVS